MAGVHRAIDGLLDHTSALSRELQLERTRRSELRDALLECLLALPDTAAWERHQNLYVATEDGYCDEEAELEESLS